MGFPSSTILLLLLNMYYQFSKTDNRDTLIVNVWLVNRSLPSPSNRNIFEKKKKKKKICLFHNQQPIQITSQLKHTISISHGLWIVRQQQRFQRKKFHSLSIPFVSFAYYDLKFKKFFVFKQVSPFKKFAIQKGLSTTKVKFNLN